MSLWKEPLSPLPDESEFLTTNEKIITMSLLTLLGAFEAYIFPNILFFLVVVLLLGGIILIEFFFGKIFNLGPRFADNTSYLWSDGSPGALNQLIMVDRKDGLANNRICNICHGTLTASQTTCLCGHIVNCIICYQPVFTAAVALPCCQSIIHHRHLSDLTKACPYCKAIISLPVSM